MTDSTHTPGPWALSRNIGPLTSAAGHVHHTIELGGRGCFTVEQKAGEKAEANVRLMAVGPELLQALRLFLRFHSGERWTAQDAEWWREITGAEDATAKIACDFAAPRRDSGNRGFRCADME